MPNYKQLPMTNWYRPSQLLDTAKRTLISTIVGQYADPRSGDSDLRGYRFFDYSKHILQTEADFRIDESKDDRDEIWIDYAADVGDGFNPTYAVAYYMSQPSLEVAGVGDPLPRGEILFFGGDGVYPTANSDRYEHQLVAPYRIAFKAGAAAGGSSLTSELAQRPHIFALPGNHDWYDSLVSFKQLFCSHIFNNRRFADDQGNGGWTTRQRRSYFTLKLPNNWWLLAVDLQLNHNIDVAQLQYFEARIAEMDPGDKIILCVPEPYWEKSIKYRGVTDKYQQKEKSIEQLDWYVRKKGVEVKAFIAGDLHHYRHFRDAAGVHKITAGGGGAFLHPTHDFEFAREPADATAKQGKEHGDIWMAGEYPDYTDSRKMGWRNFIFPYYNRTFGFMTGAIYFVLALLVQGRIMERGLRWNDDEFWSTAAKITINRMIEEPLVILVVALLLVGLVFFTDSESKTYKRVAGVIHGTAHLFATFVLGWIGYLVSLAVSNALQVQGPPRASTWYNVIWFASVFVVTFVGGYVVGSVIMGIYLYISLHFFGRHSNEAFSAMKIEGYKNFLRMHINKDGLTIYPIKIDQVPTEKEWTDAGEYYTPSGGTKPSLIENEPIVVR